MTKHETKKSINHHIPRVPMMMMSNHSRKHTAGMLKRILLHLSIVSLISIGTCTSASASASASTTTGKPHSTVQTLTEKNFDEALNDPANGLWLLKFYAPWCGHCKKLAPTLDAMASYISGKFAIGKIDCTNSASMSICKSPKFNIRGYPTLKIYKDGHFFDYSGKRDADSMIDFMEKMSLPSVSLIHSYEDFKEKFLLKEEDGGGGDNGGNGNTNGVVFVAFDPNGKEEDIVPKETAAAAATQNSADVTTVEKILVSTPFLQIYGQTARILQSTSTFALLHPKHKSEVTNFFASDSLSTSMSTSTSKSASTKWDEKMLDGPLLLRIEQDTTEPILYSGDPLSSNSVLVWIKENYMPLVTHLEGHNFRTVTSIGKALLIGITYPQDQSENDDTGHDETTNSFIQGLRHLAQYGPESITKKYKFAQMNGKKFGSFLKKFNISYTSTFPQILVLNVQNRTYYQNETITNVHDFIEGISNGTILEQEQADNSNNGGIMDAFLDWMPYSAIMVLALAGLLVWITMSILNDDDDYEYDNDGGKKNRLVLTEEQLKQLKESRKENKAKNKSLKEE